jgi:hypothetical protein
MAIGGPYNDAQNDECASHGPRAHHKKLIRYFTFIVFVACQSCPGGELRNSLHRATMRRAG